MRARHPKPRSAFAVAVAIAVTAVTAGCSSVDSEGTGYQPGELGNGGFYFSCDDAVSCAKYSNDASKFPKAVSLGSVFTVRYVPKLDTSGINIHFNDGATDRGITVQSLGPYLSQGPSGLAAVKTGYGTLASRDASGQLVDYVVVRIARPDALVVYAADDTDVDAPTPVSLVTLTRGEQRAFKAFAQENKQDLAGSLQLEWTSSNSTVAEVASTTNGIAKLVAHSAGTATLTATGGTFTQQVPIEVSP
jgi:hypothetical protein